ncbi:MAG: class I SAM-dependent methyltransferase [Anaerolineaceae bacterium]|nr:class I SAM-dependent methyltransferase [Anaerolineaceae bacterium]
MDYKHFTDANRQAWNQAAGFHKLQFEKYLQAFKEPGYSCLDDTALALLEKVEIKNKQVVQLCCNNGREILSIKNLGAARCVGFDISSEFISQGKQLAAAAQEDIGLYVLNIYDIPGRYFDGFDLVFISVGVLGWLPDLPRFFNLLNNLLISDGKVVIYEMHPILDMFEPKKTKDPLFPVDSYFRVEPFVSEEGLDYYENQEYESAASYWFHHKLCDIIQTSLQTGFELEYFQEYAHDLSKEYASFEHHKANYPLSYSLVSRKNTNSQR